jgi:very-short-patch-repair endonuclease
MSRATLARARALRREETPAESRLRRALREALPGAKFRRQVSMGPYFADLISHRCKLIVEIDGSQHAENVEQDAARTRFLESEGYRVLRFWNNEVLQNLDGVLRAIAAELPSPLVGEGGPTGRMRGARRSRAPASKAGTPHPLPSPTRGEGGSDKPSVWS